MSGVKSVDWQEYIYDEKRQRTNSFPIGMKPERADSGMSKRYRPCCRTPVLERLVLILYLFTVLLPGIMYQGSDVTDELM